MLLANYLSSSKRSSTSRKLVSVFRCVAYLLDIDISLVSFMVTTDGNKEALNSLTLFIFIPLR